MAVQKHWMAFNASQSLLNRLEIDSIPIDPFSIIVNWQGNATILVATVSQYQQFVEANRGQKRDTLKIKDARCIYYPERNTYLIVYNDAHSVRRIRFSIAHELGHIILGHLRDERTEIDRGGLDDIIYYRYEGEANTFAGNLLAPPILIQELLGGKAFSVRKVAEYFDISEPSVKNYRKADYEEWLQHRHPPAEYNILQRCKNKLFYRICRNCNSLVYGQKYRYCMICGCHYGRRSGLTLYSGAIISTLERREKAVKYVCEPMDSDYRLLRCLHCENEDVLNFGDYCHICGRPTKNMCAAEHENYHPDASPFYPCPDADAVPLPANARYCPYCGQPTSFQRGGLLKKWSEEKNGRPSTDDYTVIDDSEDLPY